jgi:hypothetical protein
MGQWGLACLLGGASGFICLLPLPEGVVKFVFICCASQAAKLLIFFTCFATGGVVEAD